MSDREDLNDDREDLNDDREVRDDLNDVLRFDGPEAARQADAAAIKYEPPQGDAVGDNGKVFQLRPRANGDAGQPATTKAAETGAVSLNDFWAYMPMHSYIFAPTRDMWPGSSVNARIPPIGKTPATAWLDQNKPVEQMTWVPGQPMIIEDRLIAAGGFIARKGVSAFNQYRPPTLQYGDESEAGPWLDHVRRVYPDDADHLIKWLAHRAQRRGRRSIMRWYSAASRASAKTRCWSR
jgi:hypothetical protein